jgi:hypothetical protein
MNRTLSTNPAVHSIRVIIAALSLGAALQAADLDVRLAPQAMVGTVGAEIGAALELRRIGAPRLVLRPEAMLNQDRRVGAGGALLYVCPMRDGLGARHEVAIGPRLVHHNADHHGWEADVMATWGYDLVSGPVAWRHSIGAIAAAGIVEDREHDDVDPAFSVGAFYAYRF